MGTEPILNDDYINRHEKHSNKRNSIPSGKLTKNYGKSPFSMGKVTISMAIFNSYVKLPEGNYHQQRHHSTKQLFNIVKKKDRKRHVYDYLQSNTRCLYGGF
jgi:hypothetical protein